MDCDVLQSVLDDLSHLLIHHSLINFDNTVELGAGGYGIVFLALLSKSQATPTNLTVPVAVKRLRIGQVEEGRRRIAIRLARELKVWALAKHPNILELIGISFSDENEYAYFVSRHLAHGNVKDYIKATLPSLAIRLKFVKGITSGIHYLHNCDPPICHGDLKPSNVLVNDGIEAVLCDFGLATFIMEAGLSSGLTTSKSAKGSTRYMSPELFRESEATLTLKSDIWAWACTAFEVITDCEPYPDAKLEGRVIALLIQGESPGSVNLLDNVVQDTNVACHPSLRSLKSVIQNCWSFNAGRRPSSSDILNRLGFLDKKATSEATRQIAHIRGVIPERIDYDMRTSRISDIVYDDTLEDPTTGASVQLYQGGDIHGLVIPSIEMFIENVKPRYVPSITQWVKFVKQLKNSGSEKRDRS